MKTTEFKNELRLLDVKYDPWGTSMDAFFNLCDILYVDRNINVKKWEYKPAIFQVVNQEQYFTELFQKCSNMELLLIGEFLHRYTNMLKYYQKDY